MGLDIYLYTAAEAAANDAHDAASNAFYERPDYEKLTEDERRAAYKALPPYAPQTDVPSERYPEHLFNRRYLRSSYNGGGFNRAVPDFVGADHSLYWIFEPMKREWDSEDNGDLNVLDLRLLRQCRERAEQVVEELRACDPMRVMTESPIFGDREHMWSKLPSEDQVLDWYRQEKATHASPEARARAHWQDGGYSNAKGLVLGFDEGFEVLAITLGADPLGRPAAAVVYRPNQDAIDSYVQSAEIIVEFIDEALGLIEKDGSARISWSG